MLKAAVYRYKEAITLILSLPVSVFAVDDANPLSIVRYAAEQVMPE